MKDLAKYIKRNIEKSGWTQKAIAEEMGISEGALSQRINARKISVETAIEIANIMGVTLNDICYDRKKKLPSRIPTHISLTFNGVNYRYELITPNEDKS